VKPNHTSLTNCLDSPFFYAAHPEIPTEAADEDMLQVARARRDDQGYPVCHRVQALDVMGNCGVLPWDAVKSVVV